MNEIKEWIPTITGYRYIKKRDSTPLKILQQYTLKGGTKVTIYDLMSNEQPEVIVDNHNVLPQNKFPISIQYVCGLFVTALLYYVSGASTEVIRRLVKELIRTMVDELIEENPKLAVVRQVIRGLLNQTSI